MPRPAPRILIVDDEKSHVQALCNTLRDQGYATTGCTAGTEALAALRAGKFDLLITDLSMPGMGGIALLAAAREVDPDLVAVMMSGSATIASAVEAMKAGALDYIAKPFRLSAILPVIARALEARQLRLRNAELERRVAERTAALEAANLELAKLYDNVPCGLHSVDENGLIVRMNDTWLAWLGYGRDEVVGRMQHADLMTPESAAAYRTTWFPLFKRQGWVRDVELEYLRKDGTTLIGLSSANVVHDDEGRYRVSESSVIDITQRRQTEAALRASEEYNRSIVEANQDCVIVLTCAGRLLSMTEQGRRLLDVDDVRRVENADWGSFWQDDDREAVRAAVAAARDGGIGRFRGFWPTFAGAPKWWDVIVAPIRGPGGAPERLLAVCRNVTEQIEIEQELARINLTLEERVLERTARLHASEARFRSLTELWADVYWETDAQFRFTSFVGGRASRFEPGRFSELIGKTRWEGNYINMTEADWAAHIALLEAHEPFRDLELCRTDQTGAPVWISVSGEPMFDAAGAFKGYCGVGRNITERKKAEEAQGRLAAIVEGSEDAIISRTLDRRIVTWNAAAEQLFGYTAAEVVGRAIDFLIPPDQQAQVEQVRALLAEGQHVPPYETVRVAKDGRRIDVSHALSPIRDARGEVVGVSLTIRDISARRQLEQQLRQSQKMQAVGQLTGGVAHDFNNLLGVVLGNLDLLERAVADNAPALKRVATAQRAAARGADLTQRLLAFSRSQALKAEAVALAGCVANVIEMARRTIGPEIEIKTTVAAELPAVRADAAGLENVLLNLMINSRDAMPQGGAIAVAAQLAELDEHYPGVRAGELPAGRYMCVMLSDTGQGMTPEVLERVFEPFFTTKERGKGTGLGLAMVYGFAKQSGGHVSIYSEPGHGTTVKLYLPLAEAGAGVLEAPQAENSHERIEATALVVDDETDLLEVAVAYLEEMGFRVLQASDGPRALELLEREPGIALLLTDVMMPGGMNGVELARRARAARPDIRVLYSTGYSSAMLDEKTGTATDAPVLTKPYRRAEFVAAIRKAMAGRPGEPGNARMAPAP